MNISINNKFGTNGIWTIELSTILPCVNSTMPKLIESQKEFIVKANEKISVINRVISEPFEKISKFYKLEPITTKTESAVITANNKTVVVSITSKISSKVFITKRRLTLKMFAHYLDKIPGKKRYPKEYINVKNKISNTTPTIQWLFSDDGIKFLEIANNELISLDKFKEIMDENNVKSPYSTKEEGALLKSINRMRSKCPMFPLDVNINVAKFIKKDILKLLSIAQVYGLLPSGHRERWEKYDRRCIEKQRLTMVTANASKNFLQKASTIYGSRYNLSKVKYINGKTRVTITCCRCSSDFKVRPTYFIGTDTSIEKCPNCRKNNKNNKTGSKGENKVAVFFDKNKIKYYREEHLDGCINPVTRYGLPMDFYVPSLNLVVEFMGAQHYKQVELFGNKLENTAFKDGLREGYCASKSIQYLAITYKEENNIEKILKPYLCQK